MSEFNGTLADFKKERSGVIEQCFRTFDEITEGRLRTITDPVQYQLHEICRDADEVQALMVYLVEECGLRLAHVRQEIKGPFVRLGFDLLRAARLVSA